MTLLFIHIPKTGGTSIIRALSGPRTKVFGAEHLGPHYSTNLQREIGEAEQYDVMIGHFRYGIHEYLSGPYEYATVLRHPAERVFSDFEYVKAVGSVHPKHNAAHLKDATLEEFLSSYWLASNVMVRQLSGMGFGFKDALDVNHLELAIANMKTIKYLGFTDALDNLFSRIQKDYGFTRELGRHNVGVRASIKTMKRDVVALILKHNQLDLALYQVAKGIVDV